MADVDIFGYKKKGSGNPLYDDLMRMHRVSVEKDSRHEKAETAQIAQAELMKALIDRVEVSNRSSSRLGWATLIVAILTFVATIAGIIITHK